MGRFNRKKSAKLFENLEQLKKPKYKNVKVEIDGLKFDSTKEGRRYSELKLLLNSGAISDLQMQCSIQLFGKGRDGVKYKADFVYTQDGKQVVEDVKSPATRKLPAYVIKKKLLKHFHNIIIKEI